MTQIETIRNMTKLNRTKFAEKYGIPLRTMEDWEHEKSNPPAYVVELLERVVREDEGLPSVYYVYTIGKNEEWLVLKTSNKAEAIKAAAFEDYINKRDKAEGTVEIRLYTHDIEAEDCECFDYNTIPFEVEN